LQKPVRNRFPRNPYTVTNIDDIWEMDLADLSSLSKYNDKYKYLLNVIDIFSRFAWGVTLKDKTSTFSLHKDTTPPQLNYTVTPTHIEPEQYNT